MTNNYWEQPSRRSTQVRTPNMRWSDKRVKAVMGKGRPGGWQKRIANLELRVDELQSLINDCAKAEVVMTKKLLAAIWVLRYGPEKGRELPNRLWKDVLEIWDAVKKAEDYQKPRANPFYSRMIERVQ